MITGNELALGLGQIKRQSVCFGNSGDKEDHKPDELGNHEPQMTLRFDDLPQIKGAGEHHHAHERQTHEYLVAQHLRRGTQAAEKRVLAPRCPPCKRDAVYPERRHGQKEQQPDVQVYNFDAWCKRDDRKGHEHDHHDHGGRDNENRLVRERWYPVFLGKNLDHVGNNHEYPARPYPVRAIAVLPEPEQPPLDPDKQSPDRQYSDEDGHKYYELSNRIVHAMAPLLYCSTTSIRSSLRVVSRKRNRRCQRGRMDPPLP
jgi:hypothetical protein